jgi:hypothetical protein
MVRWEGGGEGGRREEGGGEGRREASDLGSSGGARESERASERKESMRPEIMDRKKGSVRRGLVPPSRVNRTRGIGKLTI